MAKVDQLNKQLEGHTGSVQGTRIVDLVSELQLLPRTTMRCGGPHSQDGSPKIADTTYSTSRVAFRGSLQLRLFDSELTKQTK
jgi:hypothetical protein